MAGVKCELANSNYNSNFSQKVANSNYNPNYSQKVEEMMKFSSLQQYSGNADDGEGKRNLHSSSIKDIAAHNQLPDPTAIFPLNRETALGVKTQMNGVAASPYSATISPLQELVAARSMQPKRTPYLFWSSAVESGRSDGSKSERDTENSNIGDWMRRSSMTNDFKHIIDVQKEIEKECAVQSEEDGGRTASFDVPARIKKKRLTVEQVRALEDSFKVNQKLDAARKRELALRLGLHPRQVAVWFQNRRARSKAKNTEQKFAILKSKHNIVVAELMKLQAELKRLKGEVEPATKLGTDVDHEVAAEGLQVISAKPSLCNSSANDLDIVQMSAELSPASVGCCSTESSSADQQLIIAATDTKEVGTNFDASDQSAMSSASASPTVSCNHLKINEPLPSPQLYYHGHYNSSDHKFNNIGSSNPNEHLPSPRPYNHIHTSSSNHINHARFPNLNISNDPRIINPLYPTHSPPLPTSPALNINHGLVPAPYIPLSDPISQFLASHAVHLSHDVDFLVPFPPVSLLNNHVNPDPIWPNKHEI